MSLSSSPSIKPSILTGWLRPASLIVATSLAFCGVARAEDESALQKQASRALASLEAPTRGRQTNEVIFIDANVPDREFLAWQFSRRGEVIILDPQRDGVLQMAEEIDRRAKISGIHVVSHGSSAHLQLGNTQLQFSNLPQYRAALASMRSHLTAGADILLYGCNVGKERAGEAFVRALADATGVDVSASSNPTGGQAQGGDWELEISTGKIETASLRSAELEHDYPYVLTTQSVGTLAQLKSAIATGNTDNVDDIITLTADITMTSGADVIGINVTDAHKMTIVGNGHTISGNNVSRIFNVAQGNVALQNLTISDGFITANGGYASAANGGVGPQGGDSLGAAIYNTAGTITITGSTITGNKAAGAGGAGGQTSGFGAGGGGGGGFGTTVGGAGGGCGGYHQPGKPGTAGVGGDSAPTQTGFAFKVGHGGSTTGGAGSTQQGGSYQGGGNAGTANNGTISIGGGGGGGSYDAPGGRGGHAVGAIFNGSAGTMTITRSSITNNLGAAGGGGGGAGSYNGGVGNGGDGGIGVGAIWNQGGTVRMDSGTYASFASTNAAGSGIGGTANGGGNHFGASPSAYAKIYTSNAGTTVTNLAPSVTSVSSSQANGAYKTGATIPVTVTFGGAVDVTGTPQLTIETGTTDETLNYTSGSGTSSLTFAYTVQAGDTTSDLDYTSNTALALNGGTIKDHTTAFNATLTLPSPGSYGSLGANKDLVIDTTAPSAPSTPDLTSGTDTGTSNSDNLTKNTTPAFTGTSESGATITLYDTDGTTVLGSTTADGSGNWSITSTTLSAGAHTVTAKATDAAGNVSSASAGLSVTIDTTAPSIAITSNASNLGAGQTATITFTFSEDPGSTFTWNGSTGDVTVSGGTLSAISGSGLTRTATFTPVAGSSGTASITVAASSYTDTAGNNGGAGTTPTVTYNTAAPNAPSTPDLAAASDSGTSSSDNLTNVTTPTFTGTAQAGTTVTLYNGSTTSVIGSVVTPDGNWSITSSALSAGAHTIYAGCVDSASNASPLSSGLAVAIDTTAPTLTITSDVSTLKIGETATITFTFSEDPASTFTSGDITVSGGTLGALSGSGLTRTATFTPTAGTNSSPASITVAAGLYTDAAGNNGGAGSSPTLTFDTLAPGAPSTPDLAAASDTGFSSSDNLTKTTTPNFLGTAEAGATITLYDTDGTTVLGTTAANGSGHWLITSTTLTPGAHTVTAKATDTAGNVGSASSGLAVTIDTTAPTLAITTSATSLKAGETATITFTFSEDPGAGFTESNVTTFSGSLSAIAGSGLIRTATYTPNSSANSGTGRIQVAAGQYTDAAGNGGSLANSPDIGFDTLPPSAPTLLDLATADDHGVSNSDHITNVTTPAIHGYGESGATITLYDTDGTTVLGTTVAASVSWSITTSTLAAGSHTLTAKATDAAGNAGPASTGLTVTVDTTAPTLTITSNVSNLKIGETATITFTFSEDPGTTFTWNGSAGDVVVSGGTLGAISGTGLTRTATFTPTASANGGTVSITVPAASYTDTAGNNGGAGSSPALSFDTLAPTAPSTPVLAAGSDSGSLNSDGITNVTTPVFTGTAESGATVTLYDTDGTTVLGTATATGGEWSITSSVLAPGNHTVTARATDAAGNGSPASGGLAIVIDGTAPTVSIARQTPATATTNAPSVTFRVTFDKNVAGVDSTDFALVATGNAAGTISVVTPLTGSSYDVTATSLTGHGTLRLDLKDSGTGVADTSGNAAPGFHTGEVYSITPPNQAPSFTLSGDQSVAQDGGAQTVIGFAKTIQAGSDYESTQNVDFIVTVDKPELFKTQPAIAADGTLTYEPVPTGDGDAQITVKLHDDGGTTNGGVDTSEAQTFRISVTTYLEEAGEYNGLAQAAPLTTPSNANSGLLRVTVDKKGAFTGTLKLATYSYVLRGHFGKDGAVNFGTKADPTLALARTGLPTLQLALQLDVGQSTGKLAGTITDDGTPFAAIDADRALYSAAATLSAPYLAVPAPLLGKYTVVLAADSPTLPTTAYPQGDGVGILLVAKTGRATLVATLADGTRISYSNALSKDNHLPFYVPLLAGKGSIGGPVTFADVPNVSDLSGPQVQWYQPAIKTAKYYPAGWPDGVPTGLVGCKLTMPVAPASLLTGLAPASVLGNATLTLFNGNLPLPGLTKTLNVTAKDAVTVVNRGADQTIVLVRRTPSATINLANPYAEGFIQGKFLDATTHQWFPFYAAILQKQHVATGYFRGKNTIGSVTISPFQ